MDPRRGPPPASGRLTFRPEPDDEAFIGVFRQVAMGSLDVMTRRDVAARGADRQAREDLELYRDLPGDRDWWRLAYTAADGQLAGMILPNRNTDGAVVGYLGVLPGLRGRGYINDLVAHDHLVPCRPRRAAHRRHDRHHEPADGRRLRARGLPGNRDPVRVLRTGRDRDDRGPGHGDRHGQPQPGDAVRRGSATRWPSC